MVEVPVLFTHWEQFVGELLDRTARFPKAVRFTFASRIDSFALDVLEAIVEARYARGAAKQDALRRADIGMAKLRTFVRLAHARQYLDHRGYEHLSRGVDEGGRMLGGWRKQVADAGR